MNHLLCFGLGFSARILAARLAAQGWRISATSRSASGAETIRAMGYAAHVFDGTAPLPSSAFDGVTHVVASAPPSPQGDPVLAQHAADFAARATQLKWVAYLSTTGVYGDHDGGTVTEETPLTPNTERGRKRLMAEEQWLEIYRQHDLPVHIFRLAGIYGPGRNQLLALLDGSAKRIIKPGQLFSRIHVEDIATILEASIARPNPSLQCLRRRCLSATECGGIRREADELAGAARHGIRRGGSVADGAQFLCRFKTRFQRPDQTGARRPPGLSHLPRRSHGTGARAYWLTPSARSASRRTISRISVN